MFKGRYAEELRALDLTDLDARIQAVLRLCPELVVRDPRDVLRFLRLMILERPRLSQSRLLDQVAHRVITAVEDWSATKRLDFIDLHVIDRPLPEVEPDFGPWWSGRLGALFDADDP